LPQFGGDLDRPLALVAIGQMREVRVEVHGLADKLFGESRAEGREGRSQGGVRLLQAGA
jgi:hypothetical protein